jgi:hypothetical protein
MTSIIPFGKYAGQEIDQIRQRDPAYLQWLTQQPWFAEKFAPIYQVVINNFAPPSEDTPAHNAMQVRFLDFEYRSAFWDVVSPIKQRDKEWLVNAFLRNTEHWRKAPRPFGRRRGDLDKWMIQRLADHREEVQASWNVWRYQRLRLAFLTEINGPEFEGVTDVLFGAELLCGYGVIFEKREYRHVIASHAYRLAIEIKPCMGDDYPAVLRQMKRQKAAADGPYDGGPTHWFLLVDEFGSSAVTFDQVKQIFAQDDIMIVRASEIREQLTRRRDDD